MQPSLKAITALLLASLATLSQAAFPPLGPDDSVYWSKHGQKLYWTPPGLDGDPAQGLIDQAQARLPACQQAHPDKHCVIQSWSAEPEKRAEEPDRTQYGIRSYVRIVVKAEDCEAFMHEPHPETGEAPSACACQIGWIDAGEDIMPRCQIQEEKEACAENGEYYEQDGYCTIECRSGSALGNICLDNPDSQCDSSSDDYLGNIGYGGNQKPVCGENSCPNGGQYGFQEQADGSYQSTCFNDDSLPPECPEGTAVVVGWDNVSFQCNEISYDDPDNPDDPNDPDDSDGDSDGDGEGDITGITDQLSDIKDLLGKGNTNTTNINETLKGLGKSIRDGTQSITDAIGNIPGGGGGGGNDGGDGGDGGDGETPDPVTWSGEPIDTELTDPTEDYDQVMADYQAKINEIKGEVQAMFSTNLTGGGSVDDNIKSIHGVEVNFSLNRFLDGLNILGAIVLFCAAFISAGILFTSRG